MQKKNKFSRASPPFDLARQNFRIRCFSRFQNLFFDFIIFFAFFRFFSLFFCFFFAPLVLLFPPLSVFFSSRKCLFLDKCLMETTHFWKPVFDKKFLLFIKKLPLCHPRPFCHPFPFFFLVENACFYTNFKWKPHTFGNQFLTRNCCFL